MRTRSGECSHHRQHGAATLVVVMVLFFLMLLVAAYAGRTLIFEQRTSANQYRSAQAYEAAQGGLEWALAMLNSGQRIDAACQPSTNPADNTFRDRYLAIDVTNEKVTPATPAAGRFAACMRGQAGWQCQCPTGDMPSLVADAGTGVAFIVEMQPWPSSTPAQPLKITSQACSSGNDLRCFQSGTSSTDAVAVQSMQVALVQAMRQPPTAALVASGGVTLPSGLVIVNQAPGGNATAIRAGGSVDGVTADNVRVPGGMLPADAVVANDPSVGAYVRFAQEYLGISQTVFRGLPGTVNCSGSSCAESVVAGAASGRRLFSVGGDLTLPSTTLGTPEQPVVLVVDGKLTLQGLTTINGFVYADQLEWLSGASAAAVRGAAVIRTDCCTAVSGSPRIVYDRDILSRLRLFAGAYAKVPGSWQDR